MPRETQKSIAAADYYVRLKDVRIALGLDISQMAALAGLPEVTYLNQERQAVKRIPPEVFANFSLALGLSVDYLLGLTDVPDAYPYGISQNFADKVNTARVKELRESTGTMGRAMAEELDISAGAYSTKERHPEVLAFTILDLIRISNVFDVPVDYLIKLTDQRKRHAKGSPKKIPLGLGTIVRIKHRLGLAASPADLNDELKSYCNSHYRVRMIRIDRGLKQSDVAAAIGVNLNTYSIWERNYYRIPAFYLIKIADLYDVSLDYLVGRSDDPCRG